jgi:hypothetical protein
LDCFIPTADSLLFAATHCAFITESLRRPPCGLDASRSLAGRGEFAGEFLGQDTIPVQSDSIRLMQPAEVTPSWSEIVFVR